jgi:hypothetical protein
MARSKIDVESIGWSEQIKENVSISGSFTVEGQTSIPSSKKVNEKAISLDGVDDRIVVGDYDIFTFTDGTTDEPFSMSAWIYVGDVSADNGTIIGKFDPNVNNEWMFKQEYGKLAFYMYSGVGTTIQKRIIANSVSLSDNTWHHVVVTCAGGLGSPGYTLYTDSATTAGTEAFLNSYAGTANTSAPLTIGAADLASGNRIFEDKIADVVIFNKELSSAEVTELYNSGSVKDIRTHSAYNNVISWWKMGDDLDSTSTDGIIDYVSGYHGSVENGASIVSETTLGSDNVGPISITRSGSLGVGIESPESTLHVAGRTKIDGDLIVSSNATVAGNASISGPLSFEDYMIFSVTADNTDVQTGTSQFTFRVPFAMELYQIPRASLTTASSSGAVTIDINSGGTSIFSTNLTIDASETTSTTAATAAVLSTTSITDDTQITIDVDGAGTGARGLKITLYYRRTI